MPSCPRCHSPAVRKDGRPASAIQRYRCRSCRRAFTTRTGTPFAGYRWPREIIALTVHWYCSFRLAAANVVELLARWWCDETYLRVRGRWAYLYRAIDEDGQVVDVLLREHRDLDS